jgi:hypothetical protein
MLILAPRPLPHPVQCAECRALTDRPFYQFLGTDEARALCAPCARGVSESFTETAIDQARRIIAACNAVAKAVQHG